MRKLFALILFASFVPYPAEAQLPAYKCTPVPNSNITQVWNQRCLPYYISNNGTLLDGELRRQLILQSFRVWSDPACTDIRFMDFGYTDQAPGFDPEADDNKNIIMAIEEKAVADVFFRSGELAITVTSFNTFTGEIFDADILINASQFAFEDLTSTEECLGRSAQLPYDLRNTIVHEAGHFIGFDHDKDEESTMFDMAPECETKKRSLTQNNILGVCNVYGVAQPISTCSPPDTYEKGPGDPDDFRDQCNPDRERRGEGGCSCTSTGYPSSLFGSFLLLWAIGWRKLRSSLR